MADKPDTDEEWNTARQIWAAGAVKIPAYPDEGTLHYLTDLKRAAATFLTAKSVTETDRQRTWSRERVAKQCRDLTQLCRNTAQTCTLAMVPRVGVM